MALRCENCGADNPAINRYCGQCGARLEQAPPNLSEESQQDATAESVEPSADLPPEVIDFDNQIPLFVGEGSDRRIHPPPEVVEQVHDLLEREAELHDELQHGSEPHHEVLAKQEAERKDFLSWKINHFDEKAFFPGSATDEASAEADPPLSHQDFRPASERVSRTGVTGPSFLGLSDDSVPNFGYQEHEPKANLRRNVALVALAAVVVFAAVQWRSIRDYGLGYVQNRSMASAKRSPRNSPPIAADNASHDLETSKADSPRAARSSSPPKRILNVPQATRTPPATPVPEAPLRRTGRPPAMSAPSADVPRNNQSKSLTSASRPRAEPRRFPAQPSARSVSKNVPGSDEMKRAVNASDAEARAAWLWKALSKGNPQAPVELARMYEQGRGVVRSCDQAKVLLRSAAAKGNAQAKLDLQQIRIRGGCSTR